MELSSITLVVATLALIVTVLNAFRITSIKRKNEVDLVNHIEDVNLSMESIKFTMTRDIKYLRKELIKRNRPNNPNTQKPKKTEAVKTDDNKEDDNTKVVTERKPRRNYRKPSNRPKKPKTNEESPQQES